MTLTTEFYTTESGIKAIELEARKFLVHCQTRREEERARAKDLLPEESWSAVMDKTDRALLDGRLNWLVEGGEYRQVDPCVYERLTKFWKLSVC